nr:uncharacterized protein LOC129261514 [Lytechinus pictus]
MNEIGSQHQLVRIVERLPYHLRSRWLRSVKDIRLQGRSPSITDVVRFVSDAADEINDPVYGGLFEDRKRDAQLHKSPSLLGSRNLATHVDVNFTRSDAEVKECVLCSQNHELFGCRDFKSMKPEERFALAKEKRLCFNCLKRGHISGKCNLNRTCSVKGCNRKHTRFLHIGRNPGENVTAPVPEQKEPEAAVHNSLAEKSSNATGAGSFKIALPIVPVEVRARIADSSTLVYTYALLDSGSTTSFCTEKLAERLGAKGERKVLSVSTLERAHSSMDCNVISLSVKNPTTHHEIDLTQVYTRKAINISSKNIPKRADVHDMEHLKDLDLLSSSTDLPDVELLIGQDVPEASRPLEVRSGAPDEVYAVRTILGWTLNGPLRDCGNDDKPVHTTSFISSDDELESQLKLLWSLDSTAMLHDQSRGLSVNDKKALAVWNNTVKLKNGHYELSIPFRDDPAVLPDNYQVALGRLESLSRRLKKDEQLHMKYTKEMRSPKKNDMQKKLKRRIFTQTILHGTCRITLC